VRVVGIKKQLTREQNLNRWMLNILLLTVLIVPLAMSRPLLLLQDQFDLPKLLTLRLFLLSIVVLWSGKILITERVKFRWSRFDLALVGFLALALISSIFSIHFPTAIHGRYERYEGLLTLISYGLLYFFAVQVFSDFGRVSRLNKAIIISGGLVALYGLLQYFGLDPLPWTGVPFEERRSFATFGNPDLLAGFLVLVIPLSLAEFLRAGNKRDSLWIGFSLFLVFACLLTAFTRSAWIGAAGSLLAFMVLGGRAVFSDIRRLLAISLLFVSIFALLAVFSISSGHTVTNLFARIKSTTQITEGSAAQRLEIWKAGSQMISDNALLGSGPDTFRLASGNYETLEFVKMTQGMTVADNAHNYIIQLAATVGVPAVLLLMLFLAAAIFISIKSMRKTGAPERLVSAGLLSAIFGYLIYLLLGLSVVGSSSVFWILCGALVSATTTARNTAIDFQGARTASIKAAVAMLVLFSAISAYFALAMFRADYHYSRALFLSTAGDPNATIISYEKAIGLYKNGKYYDDYGAYLEKAGWEYGNYDLTSSSISILRDAVRFEPEEADHYIYLANTVLQSTSNPNAPELVYAEQVLNAAILKRANSIPARVILAQVMFNQNRYSDAVPILQFVLNMSPDHINGNLLMAQCLERLGNNQEALRFYRILLSLQPEHREAKASIQRLQGEAD